MSYLISGQVELFLLLKMTGVLPRVPQVSSRFNSEQEKLGLDKLRSLRAGFHEIEDIVPGGGYVTY